MADKCTLLCLKDDPESMVRLANIILTGIDKTEQDTEHKKLIIYSGSSVIKLTRKLRTVPGDEFSRLILGMHNFFNQVQTSAVNSQRKILNHIANSCVSIGVMVEPNFDDADGIYDLIFEIARELEGLIFNGSGMIDCEGHLMLDRDGTSELAND